MIQRHNAVVKPNDRVYFLGDVAISKHYIHLVGRMNGKKVLVKVTMTYLTLRYILRILKIFEVWCLIVQDSLDRTFRYIQNPFLVGDSIFMDTYTPTEYKSILQ